MVSVRRCTPYGIVAVLAQRDVQGRERPAAVASTTLGAAKKHYSQLNKEGLDVVHRMTHFNQYVAGRHVTILTHHQPLLRILGAKKLILSVLYPRARRWYIKLGTYHNDRVHRRGRLHQNTDALSRLTLPASVDEHEPPRGIHTVTNALG